MPNETIPAGPHGQLSVRSALRFIVLIGAVSCFADATYEGARSITGPYLAVLGASATVVGFVAGFGELVGYALRLASGYIADRTGRYWTIALLGYTLNLVAVPLLALTGRWEWAAALLIAERVGKAVRTPARDAMLSHATHRVGHGWGFGLHEALDQVGAVLGPLLVAAMLAYDRGSYRTGFAVLALPAVVAMSLLIAAQRLYPHPRRFDVDSKVAPGPSYPRAFWVYLAGVALIAAGYADFPLIAFHFGKSGVVSPGSIPLFYAAAMGADALSALLFGSLFDRLGMAVLAAATVLSGLVAPLCFWGGTNVALLGVAVWGIGMGAQESILRAAIPRMIPPERRGSAYGLFNMGYGVAWFLGSLLMGYLYDVSPGALVGFSVTAQLAAVPLLLLTGAGQSKASSDRAEPRVG